MSADRQMALAVQFHRAGALDQAGAAYRQILEAAPNHAEARHLLGVVALQKEQLEVAITDLTRAVVLAPDNAVYHCRLGIAYSAACQAQEALARLETALSLNPDYPEAHNNIGTVLAALGRLDDAITHYEQAIQLQPQFPEAWNNLGVSLKDAGRQTEAVGAFEAALAARPDYAEARKNLGMAALLGGRFDPGFKNFDWRFQEPGAWRRPFTQPNWRGDWQDPGQVLIWGEQGIGDEVMYGTLLQEFIDRTDACIIECEPRLVPLFERAFRDQTIVARSDPPHPSTSAPEVTSQIAIGSLCQWLRPDRDSFGSGHAYLSADSQKSETLVRKYRQGLKDDELVIGVAWESRLHSKSLQLQYFADTKSCPLTEWGAVFAARPARFVSLQYGDCTDAVRNAADTFGVDFLIDSSVDQFASLDDFAAQISAMDLVISTSNTAAHLAGALGIPVWVLLSHVPDWRWQAEGEQSLWYPDARLFRQTAPGQWDGPMRSLAKELQSFRRD